MGSRTESRDYAPSIINPGNNPFKHIVPVGDRYEYVAQLHGLELGIGVAEKTRSGLWACDVKKTLEIGLLPPIVEVPPPEIEAKGLVRKVIGENADLILSSILDGSNMIACAHGAAWGFLPEEQIASLLREKGFRVWDAFPRIGGRKRIQEHGVWFSKTDIFNFIKA